MRNSQIIRTIDNDITLMAQQAQQTVLNKSDKGRIKLDIKKLLFYNHSIQREIIKEILPTLEFKEIESLLELVNKPTGKRLEINPKMSVCKEYGYLHIAENKQKTHELIDKTWKVNIGENTKIPEIGLELNADITKKIKMSFDNDSTVFDNSQIIPPLSIRLRKPGDRFIPFKGKEKKLKDILIDDKIPVRMRDQLPLLCDANNILWIIGSRRSNIGLITNKTKECLIIKVRKKKLN
jgi:tRNA(Ile)-lysidine synthase